MKKLTEEEISHLTLLKMGSTPLGIEFGNGYGIWVHRDDKNYYHLICLEDTARQETKHKLYNLKDVIFKINEFIGEM